MEADGPPGGAAQAGFSGDEAVEDDGDEETTGEDEAAAGGVEAQGSELEVGLLGVALEGGLEHAGLGAGVKAAAQSGSGDRTDGLLVSTVAHADRLGGAGGGGEKTVKGEQILRRDRGDAGPEAGDGVGPGAACRQSGVSGVGEVEEAGDEEALRAVLLGQGVEAPRPQLEGHARAGAVEDAQRNVTRIAMRGPGGRGTTSFRAGFGRPWRRRGLGGRRPRRRRARPSEWSGRDGPVRRRTGRPIHVFETVEVRRPIAQARVEVAVALAFRRGAEAGKERGREPSPRAVRGRAPIEMEAEVVELRSRFPLDRHRRVETPRPERGETNSRRRREVLVRPDVPPRAVVPRLAVDIVGEGLACAGVERVGADLEVKVDRGGGRDEVVRGRPAPQTAPATRVGGHTVGIAREGPEEVVAVVYGSDVHRGDRVPADLQSLARLQGVVQRAVGDRDAGTGEDVDRVLAVVVDDAVADLHGVGIDDDADALGGAVAATGRVVCADVVDDEVPEDRAVAGDVYAVLADIAVAVDLEPLEPRVGQLDVECRFPYREITCLDDGARPGLPTVPLVDAASDLRGPCDRQRDVVRGSCRVAADCGGARYVERPVVVADPGQGVAVAAQVGGAKLGGGPGDGVGDRVEDALDMADVGGSADVAGYAAGGGLDHELGRARDRLDVDVGVARLRCARRVANLVTHPHVSSLRHAERGRP